MTVCEIQSLTRDYGNGRGVFDLSFSINQGEVFGFLGPNGAGKTTTIRHLMGFLKPEKGYCTIGGKDCWKDCADIQKTLGYIPGEMVFFDDMTGTEFYPLWQNTVKQNQTGAQESCSTDLSLTRGASSRK